MPFEATIADFAAALRDPAAPPPAATFGRKGAPDGRRFAVYRNNVAVGLIGAIEARYPVDAAHSRRRGVPGAGARLCPGGKAALAGADRLWREFSRLSRRVVRKTRPALSRRRRAARERVGRGLPRRRRRRRQPRRSRRARSAALGRGADRIPPGRAAPPFRDAGRLALGFRTGRVPPPPRWQGEDVLVTRPEADVSVRILPVAGYAFAGRLRDGATLAEAAEALPDRSEFGTHLVGLVASGAVRSIIPGERP